ncbi:dihydroneopterin aldolase [Sphingomonas naphthae]|uniref:Dihydroneopterin aldolase n=1 Tax=Sphingomonas naphthae TaxID=1813468 RepID=A0ABY7THD2_9SPHN|nr:dihydroneopterin aldolase [Sphingomonas naphthae]WCT72560.1 dihydroneopterin aldolase [Sphingomonas naphthae]
MSATATLPIDDFAAAPLALPDSDPRDLLRLEVSDVKVDVLTGVYSEETHLPQPLLISVTADMIAPDRFTPDTPLAASKNYMDLRFAIDGALPTGQHFVLIEAVADHIADTLFLQDARIVRVEVKVVKLAISHGGERIGMTLSRHRPQSGR